MQIPMPDLKAQYAAVREEILAAFAEVLDTQLVCNGPAVRDFESALAAYCGAAAAMGVSSGTDALLLCLTALGVGRELPACRLPAGEDAARCPGAAEVITTPFTFFGTAGAIWRVGARPVFVDIEPDTFNIDASRIASAVTEHTKAIMPVHLYGQAADMDAIQSVAEGGGLPVIEDAAQSIGAEFGGRRAGSIGTAGCLSFYPTKNLGAVGDAGAVVTQDRELADRIVALRNHGQTGPYAHDHVGGNFRMDSLQAAALAVKLRRLDAWTERRRANAARYDELLSGCEEVTTPVVRDGRRHVFYQYVVRARRRDELRAFLEQQGVRTAVYYPLALHLQPCFAGLGHKAGDFPVAEAACREVLALPVYPELTDEQLAYVAERVKAFYAGGPAGAG
jgi:dTDP-4-amino-4,6-dideoxygalactose transaminase